MTIRQQMAVQKKSVTMTSSSKCSSWDLSQTLRCNPGCHSSLAAKKAWQTSLFSCNTSKWRRIKVRNSCSITIFNSFQVSRGWANSTLLWWWAKTDIARNKNSPQDQEQSSANARRPNPILSWKSCFWLVVLSSATPPSKTFSSSSSTMMKDATAEEKMMVQWNPALRTKSKVL